LNPDSKSISNIKPYLEEWNSLEQPHEDYSEVADYVDARIGEELYKSMWDNIIN